MRNQAGWPAAWELDTHPLVSSGLGHQSVQATYLGQTTLPLVFRSRHLNGQPSVPKRRQGWLSGRLGIIHILISGA